MSPVPAVHPRRIGHPGYNVTMAREPETVAEARRLVRVSLATWGLDDATEAAELVMSELVTNAVRHARLGAVRLIIDRPAEDRVYLAVVDRSPGVLPHLKVAGIEDVTGRGLLMVDVLTEQWGYDLLGVGPRHWGKRVWARLAAAKADLV
ncbi:ATP-binding protein [Streptomyces sp. NPDC046821]|uniref:ATP-binding protein n=1 Tax=Streptomyces sp. NPDC046821 TaxID=3154702 RepID=UPI0033F89396